MLLLCCRLLLLLWHVGAGMRERELAAGRTLSAARGLQGIYVTVYFPCVALVVQVVVAKTLTNRYNYCSRACVFSQRCTGGRSSTHE